MKRRFALMTLVPLLWILTASLVYAQVGGGFDLSWSTIDGGGGTFSTGNNFNLGGTAGQPDAGTLVGGTFTLDGGFWRPADASPTSTATIAPTITQTNSPTFTPGTTATRTPTASPSGTPTPTAALISTSTPSATMVLASSPTATPSRTASATPTYGPDWTIVPSPNNGRYDSFFNAVAAVSPNDVWAVGEYGDGIGPEQALIEHWDGTAWIIDNTLSHETLDNSLEGIVAIATDNIWAVGWYINSDGVRRTMTDHWEGTHWNRTYSPNYGSHDNRLFGVAAGPDGRLWAVGDYDTGEGTQQPLIEYWFGTDWVTVSSPSPGSGGILRAVTAISANDAWAVGTYIAASSGVEQTLVVRWNGSDWRIVGSPNQGSFDNGLEGVSAVSTNNVFAVGDYWTSSIDGERNTLIEHWNGTAWTILESPNPGQPYNSLTGVAAVLADDPSGGYDVWAVGDNRTGNGPVQTLAERLNGFLWGVERTANQGSQNNSLVAIAASSTSDVWAVGSYRDATAGVWHTLVERYDPCANCATATPTVGASSTPGPSPTACALVFEDLPTSNTFYPYIRCLACRGIMSGYPCGTNPRELCNPNGDPYFRPGSSLTRGELSKMVSNAAGYNDPQPNQVFEDVPLNSTFQVYIGRIASRGFIEGYHCGALYEPCVPPDNLPYFRPNNNVTRAQTAKIVSEAAGLNAELWGPAFEDVSVFNPFYEYIQAMANNNVMTGYHCGAVREPCISPDYRPYFRPNNDITRGQAAKVIANAFFPNCQTPSGIER